MRMNTEHQGQLLYRWKVLQFEKATSQDHNARCYTKCWEYKLKKKERQIPP